VAEVALVTDSAPIRVDGEKAVEQELEGAFSFGPADRRGSTAWTNGGPNQKQHLTTTLSGLPAKYTPQRKKKQLKMEELEEQAELKPASTADGEMNSPLQRGGSDSSEVMRPANGWRCGCWP
jgi:hypothetical protein